MVVRHLALAGCLAGLALAGCLGNFSPSACYLGEAKCEDLGNGTFAFRHLNLTAQYIQFDATKEVRHLIVEDVHVHAERELTSFFSCTCTVQGQDFSVTGGPQSDFFWPGFWSSGGNVTIRGISVSGFRSLDAGGVLHVDDFSIRCPKGGMSSRGILRLSNGLMDGCALGSSFGSRQEMDNVTFQNALGVAVYSDTRESRTIITNSTFVGNKVGLHLHLGSPDANVVKNSRFERNGRGIELEDEVNLTVVASTFKDNAEAAIIGTANYGEPLVFLNVTGSVFSGNGMDCGSCSIRGAVVGPVRGDVHASSFTGNFNGVSMANPHPQPYELNATGNWWGDMLGPRYRIALSLGAGNGDTIEGTLVRAEPHLTSPP